MSGHDAAERWLEPLGLIHGTAATEAVRIGRGLPFQGGPAVFTLARLIHRDRPAMVVPVDAIPPSWHDLLAPLTRQPPAFEGDPGRPLVMGILNLTPDSFSGDGATTEAAIARGHAMLEAGADILDIGGESTRPGAEPVPAATEIARVLPVLRELAGAAPVSIDTRNAATMEAALAAGATIVNDVSALRHDREALAVVARHRAPVVLMHMLGLDPRHMQDDPHYDDVVLDVARFLRDRIAAAEAAGIPRARIAIDPGIGFGKTLAHNLTLLDRLPLLAGLGCRILVGASRKGFLGRLSGIATADRRLPANLAAALFAASRGAGILRVHDVAETVQALRVAAACTTTGRDQAGTAAIGGSG